MKEDSSTVDQGQPISAADLRQLRKELAAMARKLDRHCDTLIVMTGYVNEMPERRLPLW